MQTEFDKTRAKISTMIAVNGIPLPVTNNQGDRWVVIMLASESLTTLVDRVCQVGGYANVFVQMADGVVQFDMVDQECAIVEDRNPVEIYPDNTATVGAFVDALRNASGAIGLKVHQDTCNALAAREAKVLTPALSNVSA